MVEPGFIPIGASQIYYESSGDGPAVLFLHAGVADSRMSRAQMSHLPSLEQPDSFNTALLGFLTSL